MSEKTEKNTTKGRPKIQLDCDQIRRLSELQCSRGEIAYVMGCSVDTLDRHHKDDINQGKAQGKIKLRRAMYRNAVEKDNAVMQIWLSKNYLGFQDNPATEESSSILPWEESKDDSK